MKKESILGKAVISDNSLSLKPVTPDMKSCWNVLLPYIHLINLRSSIMLDTNTKQMSVLYSRCQQTNSICSWWNNSQDNLKCSYWQTSTSQHFGFGSTLSMESKNSEKLLFVFSDQPEYIHFTKLGIFSWWVTSWFLHYYKYYWWISVRFSNRYSFQL